MNSDGRPDCKCDWMYTDLPVPVGPTNSAGLCWRTSLSKMNVYLHRIVDVRA